MSEDQLNTSWSKWSKTNSPQDMNEVLTQLEQEIKKVSTSYASQVSPSIAKARVKKYAIDAIKTYNPSMGAGLKTHFYNHIRPMAREMKSITESAPMSKHYETMANKYVNYNKSFQAENGREPDDSEVMDGLGITPRQLSMMQSSIKYEIPDTKVDGYDFEDKDDALRNKIDMWTDYVYFDLSPKGKKVLDMKMGRHGHPAMSNIDVAKALGISVKEVAEYSETIARKIIEGTQIKGKTS